MRGIAVATVFSMMLCPGLAAAEQSAQQRADAAFQQGVERFREGDFVGAFEHFRASYDANPTPALRYNIGVCHYNLRQWADARRELSAYLDETDPELVTAERRERVEGLLAEIDGRLTPDRAPAPPPRPVEHPATPEPADAAETQEEPAAAPIAPPVAPEGRRRISRAWFWVTAGLVVALAAGGSVTGALVLGQESDFDALVEECASGARQACREDGVVIRDRADALVAATNALFATAGAAAVAAFILAFFTEWRGERRTNPSVSVSPMMGPSRSDASGLLVDVSLRF